MASRKDDLTGKESEKIGSNPQFERVDAIYIPRLKRTRSVRIGRTPVRKYCIFMGGPSKLRMDRPLIASYLLRRTGRDCEHTYSFLCASYLWRLRPVAQCHASSLPDEEIRKRPVSRGGCGGFHTASHKHD